MGYGPEDDGMEQRPREHDSPYMGWIAALPCLACLIKTGQFVRPVQVAHLRAGSREHNKRPTGMAEKPNDRWTTPLCFRCHNGGSHSQHHRGDEVDWWSDLGIKVFDLCLELNAAYDAGKSGLTIIVRAAGAARRERMSS